MPTPPHDIDGILSDLYAIDPELKSHDAQLRTMVQQLLDQRPNPVADDAFIEQLKRTILERSETILAHKPTFFEKLSTMQKSFLYPATAAVVLIVAATAGVLTFLKYPGYQTNQEIALTSNNRDYAFGPLTSNPAMLGKGAGMGGGGGLTTGVPPVAENSATQAPEASRDGADSKLIYPGPYNIYTYAYTGEPIELTDAKLPVIRRIKTVNNSANSSIFGGFSSLLNAGAFSNLKTSTITLNEDRDFGYSVSIDYNEGAVSLTQNWQRWPHPENNCRDEACYSQYRLKESDMISDSEAIAIADRFIAEYGIKLQNYGAAQVRNDWRQYFDRLPVDARSTYWFPESVTVTYPQIMDGQTVYDESGQPTGVMVSVNVRHKRVDNAYGLTTQTFETSNYDMETNAQRIIDLATKGGYNYPIPLAETGVQVNNITVNLGTPTRILMKMYRWNGYTSDEIYVPTLRFPIVNPPEGFYQTSIVIPLATDLLEQRYNPNTYGGYGGGAVDLKVAPPAATTDPAAPVSDTPAQQ